MAELENVAEQLLEELEAKRLSVPAYTAPAIHELAQRCGVPNDPAFMEQSLSKFRAIMGLL